MKFKFGLSEEEIESRMEWHRWFAWHPVRVYGKQGNYMWLEHVERRYPPMWPCYKVYDHRSIEKESKSERIVE
jgi:hypothetical protein